MVLIGAAVLVMVGAVPAVGDVVRWHRDNRRAHRGARPGQQEVLIVPAPLGHDRHRAPPSTFLGYFLVLYLRAYMAMLGQVSDQPPGVQAECRTRIIPGITRYISCVFVSDFICHHA